MEFKTFQGESIPGTVLALSSDISITNSSYSITFMDQRYTQYFTLIPQGEVCFVMYPPSDSPTSYYVDVVYGLVGSLQTECSYSFNIDESQGLRKMATGECSLDQKYQIDANVITITGSSSSNFGE